MSTMNAERFQTLAGAYGGDLLRWPSSEQAAARAFMADDRRCAEWLAEAAVLDSFLAAAQGPAGRAASRRVDVLGGPGRRLHGRRRRRRAPDHKRRRFRRPLDRGDRRVVDRLR